MRSLSVVALSAWIANALDSYGGGSGVVTTDPIEVSYQDSVVVFRMPVDYTYHRANLWCQESFGTRLASIHNEYTEQQVKDGLKAVGLEDGDGWIGLYSDGSVWRWQDTSGMNYERWDIGSGDGGVAADQRGVFVQDSGEWNQVVQSYRTKGVVCAGHSFAMHDERVTDAVASSNCKSFYDHSHLLTIHTPELNARLKLLGTTYYGAYVSGTELSIWIGFHDDHDEGKFYWVDGSPTTYLDWDGGEPNDAGSTGIEDCATLRHPKAYEWNDVNCGHTYSYLCSTPSNHGDSVVFSATHNGVEYSYHVTNWYATWEQAEEYCKNTYNEHVASIPNAEINEKIRKAAKGLGVSEIWIGYEATAGQVWEWTDGSPHIYHHWGPNQPVAHEQAQMETTYGFWENVAGSTILGGVVCNRGGPTPEIKAVKSDVSAAATTTTTILTNSWMAVIAASLSILALFGLYFFYSSPKSSKKSIGVESQYGAVL